MDGVPKASGSTEKISCVKFSPLDPNLLVTGGSDKTMTLYDARFRVPVLSISGPFITGDAIDINPKDGKILTGSCTPD